MFWLGFWIGLTIVTMFIIGMLVFGTSQKDN